MGNSYTTFGPNFAAWYNRHFADPEHMPESLEAPTFDPLIGFPNGRKVLALDQGLVACKILFKADIGGRHDGMPVYLKKGLQDRVLMYATIFLILYGYAVAIPHIGKLIMSNVIFCFAHGLQTSTSRTFVIDYENNMFLKDGKPFRYASGSMHYWRIPRFYWADRLQKLKAAGLNTVQCYIMWNLHEPQPGQFDFSGNKDFVAFFRLAQEMGLHVILRPGPYIDAEVEMGGLPFWILAEEPHVVLRTSDPAYVKWVDAWFDVLIPKLTPLLYPNGGPIIMSQIENEYGSYFACDKNYTQHLLSKLRSHWGDAIPYFTCDGPSDRMLKCGAVPGTLTTANFGPGTDVKLAFNLLRRYQPNGPLVDSEVYTGWLDHWSYRHSTRPTTQQILTTVEAMLKRPEVSFSLYVFHGGTNWGFSVGSNSDPFRVITTSYDYHAPLTEAGDITATFLELRDLLGRYVPHHLGPIPVNSPKMPYGPIQMKFVSTLLDLRLELLSGRDKPIPASIPLTFEELRQSGGFVLYLTTVDHEMTDPVILNVGDIHDRGYIFVDEELVGIVSREQGIHSIPIRIQSGQYLGILVENQGRICYGPLNNDFKGILGNVTLSFSPQGESFSPMRWAIYPFPFNDTQKLFTAVEKTFQNKVSLRLPPLREEFPGAMSFYLGKFILPTTATKPVDTFLDMTGWGKGIVFLNGVNLGRYWSVGPQQTLYLPKVFLHAYPAVNKIIVFEQESSPCFSKLEEGHTPETLGDFVSFREDEQNGQCEVVFVDKPVLNGPTPHYKTPQEVMLEKMLTDQSALLEVTKFHPIGSSLVAEVDQQNELAVGVEISTNNMRINWRLTFCTFISCFFTKVLSSETWLLSAPSNLKLHTGVPLAKSADFLQLLESVLGLSSSKCSWSGVTVVSPFGASRSLALVQLDTSSSAEILRSIDGAIHFPSKRDLDVPAAVNDLDWILATKFGEDARVKRQDEVNTAVMGEASPSVLALNASAFTDSYFLAEISALKEIPEQLDDLSKVFRGPQVLQSSFRTMALLESEYGKDSPQFIEAKVILKETLNEIVQEFQERKMTLVISSGEKMEDSNRTKRQAAADENDDTFTAIFNIMIWFTVFMVIALIYISVGIGSMDPGRDSIIYRMTSTRMKKDN
ncbi:unnamed protein product [Cyprideis torosa]|uniref:Beta-galactosidase n=1 Tax=Cyprideis torosa TaxID=163714 RepID=A0A7R8ZHK4_9CRUS|nr:unnamed protein product [Cyprideis torosa]CAG0882717.1 unnamed protein product [Cyprideis torosa]